VIGDGLGPDEIWQDNWLLNGSFNGAYIHENNYAFLPATTLVEHQAAAKNEHSFVEIQLATDLAGPSYNVDLRGRVFSDGNSINFYFLKFARQWQSAGPEPDLVLNATGCPQNRPASWQCKSGGDDGFDWIEMARWNLSAAGHAEGGAKCTSMPPLGDSPDHKVWLRLRIEDDAADRPEIIGGVGWMDDGSDCPSTSDLSGCDRWCEFSVSDTSDNRKVFQGQKGRWGVWSHDVDHRMHVFRAGSEPGS